MPLTQFAKVNVIQAIQNLMAAETDTEMESAAKALAYQIQMGNLVATMKPDEEGIKVTLYLKPKP
jgi:hypothetical protein